MTITVIDYIRIFPSAAISIPDSSKYEACLQEIQRLLLLNGKSLGDYPTLPKPSGEEVIDTSNHMILHELNFNRDECS